MTTQLELSELKRVWIDDAANAIIFCRIPGVRFSVETLHKHLDEPPHPNWWGCLVAKLRCSGKIKEVGRIKSTRPERNGAKIGLYEVV